MKNYKSFHFAFAAAAAMGLSLTACGDDVTEVIIDHEGGVTVLEAGEKLSKQACDTTNVGEMLFVTDSSEVFVCDGESWQTFKGEKGETGAAGKNGSDGANGTSCTVKPVKNKADLNGLEVTCGKTVVDTIWNGAAGKDGKPGDSGKDGSDGANGTSCTAKSVENDAGLKGFELTCGETVVGTIWDGQKGSDGGTGKDGVGCSLTDDGNGSVEVTCGEGDDATTATLYKAVCDTKPYDPGKAFCSEGELYDLCGGKSYEPKKQYCLKVTRNETDIYTVEDLLTDGRDKQVYKTVEIGDQVWMAENLNYNGSAKSYCYGDVSSNCDTYGRLYTWEVAMDNADCAQGYTCNASLDPEIPVRGVCPEGWHLPSHHEFEELINYIDPDFEIGHLEGASSSTAGKYLKSQTGWNNDGNGTDAYGFSALPAGVKYYDAGSFNNKGISTVFWSSGESGSDGAFYLSLNNENEEVSLTGHDKFNARSVRCIKD